jgi:hypothetical protein
MPKKLSLFLTFLICVIWFFNPCLPLGRCVICAFAEEQITITTYYPSPYGSYKELGWGNYPNTRGLLRADQGSSLELGGSGTPYIDFSNDMSSDYDVRIRLINDDTLAIEGGTITGVAGCRRYFFTNTSGTQTCPAGYSITQAPLSPTAQSGVFLCCRYE